jgi:hypothetical protein
LVKNILNKKKVKIRQKRKRRKSKRIGEKKELEEDIED